ncbi:MAG: hypothetical protein ABIC57_03495 [bacterium]
MLNNNRKRGSSTGKSIFLSEEEFRNLRVVVIPKAKFVPSYCIERDKFWKEVVSEGIKVGKKFWNGTIYALESLDFKGGSPSRLVLTTIEYKDFLLENVNGRNWIVKNFGRESFYKNCWVSVLPITSDGKIVCGLKKSSEIVWPERIAYISGGLNQDETKVKDTLCIREHAYKEFIEETNVLKIQKGLTSDDLFFSQIIICKSHVEFQFMVKLEISSRDVDKLNCRGEFKLFVAFSKDELLKFKGKILPEFKRMIAQVRKGTHPILRFRR